jgi:hypothetical protein
LSFPGCCLAYSISSFTELTGTDGWMSRMPGTWPMKATGVKD